MQHIPPATEPGQVADLARNWARLRQKPARERRIAIILANHPNRDGRIGNEVGLDTPQSAAVLLSALQAAGYRVESVPANGAELMTKLLSGPTNARPERNAEESLSFATYSAVFAALPMPLQRRIVAQWGSAERDPFFRPGRLDCGRFAIPALRCGNIAVLV
ncbi:MAG: cobaltochelatase subunit CobN, partial [Stellaceae bacterium]